MHRELDESGQYPLPRKMFAALSIDEEGERRRLFRRVRLRRRSLGLEHAAATAAAERAMLGAERSALFERIESHPDFVTFCVEGDPDVAAALLGFEMALASRDLLDGEDYGAEAYLRLLWPLASMVETSHRSMTVRDHGHHIRLVMGHGQPLDGLRLEVAVDRTGLFDPEDGDIHPSPIDFRLEYEPGGSLVARFDVPASLTEPTRLETVAALSSQRGTLLSSTVIVDLGRVHDLAATTAVQLIAAVTGMSAEDALDLMPFDDDEWHLARSERNHDADWNGIRSFPVLTLDQVLATPAVAERAARPREVVERHDDDTLVFSVSNPEGCDPHRPLLVHPHPGRRMVYTFLDDQSGSDRAYGVQTVGESEADAYARCTLHEERPRVLWSVTAPHVDLHVFTTRDGVFSVRAGSPAEALARARAADHRDAQPTGIELIAPSAQSDASLQTALAEPMLDHAWAPLIRALGGLVERLDARRPHTLQMYARALGFDPQGSPYCQFLRQSDGSLLAEVWGPEAVLRFSSLDVDRRTRLLGWRAPGDGSDQTDQPDAASSPNPSKVYPASVSGATIAADALAMLTFTWEVEASDPFAILGDADAFANADGIGQIEGKPIWRLR